MRDAACFPFRSLRCFFSLLKTFQPKLNWFKHFPPHHPTQSICFQLWTEMRFFITSISWTAIWKEIMMTPSWLSAPAGRFYCSLFFPSAPPFITLTQFTWLHRQTARKTKQWKNISYPVAVFPTTFDKSLASEVSKVLRWSPTDVWDSLACLQHTVRKRRWRLRLQSRG